MSVGKTCVPSLSSRKMDPSVSEVSGSLPDPHPLKGKPTGSCRSTTNANADELPTAPLRDRPHSDKDHVPRDSDPTDVATQTDPPSDVASQTEPLKPLEGTESEMDTKMADLESPESPDANSGSPPWRPICITQRTPSPETRPVEFSTRPPTTGVHRPIPQRSQSTVTQAVSTTWLPLPAPPPTGEASSPSIAGEVLASALEVVAIRSRIRLQVAELNQLERRLRLTHEDYPSGTMQRQCILRAICLLHEARLTLRVAASHRRRDRL
jgi:hypothetical protein